MDGVDEGKDEMMDGVKYNGCVADSNSRNAFAFHQRRLVPVRPDLVNICQFGKTLKIFGNISRICLV